MVGAYRKRHSKKRLIARTTQRIAVVFILLAFYVACQPPPEGCFSPSPQTVWQRLLDASFGADGIAVYSDTDSFDYGEGIAIDSHGRILVAGVYFLYAAFEADMATWRFTPDGVLDTTFGYGGIATLGQSFAQDYAYAVAVDNLDRVLVAGITPVSYDTGHMLIWRYTQEGVLDTSFGTDGIVTHHNIVGPSGWGSSNSLDRDYAIALGSAGKILVAGFSYGPDDTSDMVLLRHLDDGSLDQGFGDGGIVSHDNAAGGNGWDAGFGMTIDSNGKILVAGRRNRSGAGRSMAVWRFSPDGALDESFGYDGVAEYIGSDGTPDRGFGSDGIAVYSADRSSYDSGRAITVDAFDRIVIAGGSKGKTDGTDMAIWRLK